MILDRRILVAVTLALALALVFEAMPRSTASENGTRQELHERWRICNAEISVVDESDKAKSSSVNTILLDTETGETWLLWPSKDAPASYAWFPVRRNEK